MEGNNVSIPYLSYLFSLTEMRFLSQSLSMRGFGSFHVDMLLRCRTRKWKANNKFLEQANVKTSCTLKCQSSGGKHHQTPVLVFISFPGLKMISHAVGLRLHNVLYGCNWVSLFQLFFIPQFIHHNSNCWSEPIRLAVLYLLGLGGAIA